MLFNKSEKYDLVAITEADFPLLQNIYASTREKELIPLANFSPMQYQLFIKSQFLAQHQYYQQNYLGAFFWKILVSNQTIGRLYLKENFEKKNTRIIDISILPEYRNNGIGTVILQNILLNAKENDQKVSIHVEANNPARALYERLGFKKVSETNGVYFLFEWKTQQ